mmetsp:Transcript_85226/g.264832  ORF Transcript_85226/g.264832 Transcript_85226/m.264832 type:complete len:328 (+) Transcript_85226:215-1198(+)
MSARRGVSRGNASASGQLASVAPRTMPGSGCRGLHPAPSGEAASGSAASEGTGTVALKESWCWTATAPAPATSAAARAEPAEHSGPGAAQKSTSARCRMAARTVWASRAHARICRASPAAPSSGPRSPRGTASRGRGLSAGARSCCSHRGLETPRSGQALSCHCHSCSEKVRVMSAFRASFLLSLVPNSFLTNCLKSVMSFTVATFDPRSERTVSMKSGKAICTSAPWSSAWKMKSARSTRAYTSTSTFESKCTASGLSRISTNSCLEIMLSPSLSMPPRAMIPMKPSFTVATAICSLSVAATALTTSHRTPISMFMTVRADNSTKT